MTTEREKAFGNQIFFSTNRLQYASIQDKINYVVQMGDRGRTSINEDREVFNLPPIEGGERHFIIAVDKSVGSGIMEERDYIQNPDTGKMEGSTGGGSSGGSSGSGKRDFSPLTSDKVVETLRNESDEWINRLTSEQVYSLKKYTKNSGDKDNNKFYQRLNSMLRGDAPENETLRKHAEHISSALKKNKLKHDILCYRSTDHNPVEGLKPGDTYEPKQFLSSSVTKKGALQSGKYQMVIRTPKGSCGAYIEGLSKYPKQREFLFDYSCKYKLIKANKKTSIWEVKRK